MAKGITPTTTRLAATVNARYYPVEGVADAYCMDGKLPGKRETRSVNMTMDRDSRGFLIAVYGYPMDGRNKTEAGAQALVELSKEMTGGNVTIDNAINDLAEAAIEVTGRLEVHQEAIRDPYFAGIMVHDGEMAALTVGNGIALIFRHDVLYPLTSSVRDLKATDLYGDPVDGIDDFIAGDAGTISYSNIAQLEEGDRFILCNEDLYQSIGQDGILRILSESEDQMDASSEMITYAAANMPGKPLQVIAISVEKLQMEDSPTSRFSLGRFATQAMEPVLDVTPARSEPKARPTSEISATQRYQKQDRMDFSAPKDELRRDQSSTETPFDRISTGSVSDDQTVSADVFPWSKPDVKVDDTPPYQGRRVTRDMTSPFDDLSTDDPKASPRDTYFESTPSPTSADRYADDYNVRDAHYDGVGTDGDYDDAVGSQRDAVNDLPEFAYTSAHQRRRSRLQDLHARDNRWGDNYGQTSENLRSSESYDDDEYDEFDHYDDYDEDFDDSYSNDRASTSWSRRRPYNKKRRIVFYALLVAVIVICIIALIKLLTQKDKPAESKPSLPNESSDIIKPSRTESQDTTAPSESAEPDPSSSETDPKPSGNDAEITYTIVTGDSWWSICMQYYNTATETLCQKLAEYNGKSMTDHIHTGEKIKIPPLTVLTGSGD